MHVILGAAGTSEHQQSSQVGHTARLCPPGSGLRQSAVAARIGSSPQFPTIESVGELWLCQSVEEKACSHPRVARCVVMVFCGKDHRF